MAQDPATWTQTDDALTKPESSPESVTGTLAPSVPRRTNGDGGNPKTLHQ